VRRIIGLFLLSLFVCQFAFAGDDIADPREWDFGQVKQGEVLKHDFLLKNDTVDVLKINSINTSCGCTASQADKQEILPGESATINVTFNSHGYLGEVKQFVYVNTDNADLSIVRFIIKAQVVKNT
jgi:hypothetical protein